MVLLRHLKTNNNFSLTTFFQGHASQIGHALDFLFMKKHFSQLISTFYYKCCRLVVAVVDDGCLAESFAILNCVPAGGVSRVHFFTGVNVYRWLVLDCYDLGG